MPHLETHLVLNRLHHVYLGATEFHNSTPRNSRAANQPLRPQTRAADRAVIADAVLQVGDGDIAAAAESAGGESKALHTLPVRNIARIVPQFQQAAFPHVADDVPA